jgi:transposase
MITSSNIKDEVIYMLGKNSGQITFNDIALWNGGDSIVDPDSLYGHLAKWGDSLIRDEDFENLYAGKGRPSISPALLAKVLLLMYIEDVSDREAEQRARFDLRWKVALDLPLTESGFDHTALCRFRTRLVLNEQHRVVFDRFLSIARDAGLVKDRGTQIVDSTYILGASAVQDTYQMIRTVLRQTTHHLRKHASPLIHELAQKYEKEPNVDWQDTLKRREYLQELVDDSQNLLNNMQTLDVSDPVRATADILAQIIQQDVDTTSGQAEIRQGVAADRVISAHDPEMRHGRKTHHLRFDGHKGQVMIDEKTEIITNVDVIMGNRPDDEAIKNLLDTAPIKPLILLGDTAYGTLAAREEMEKQQVIPVAPLAHAAPAAQRKNNRFTKGDFIIDMQNKTCQCPASQITTRLTISKKYSWFRFSTKTCNPCPLRDRCTKHGSGRDVEVHPQEARRQEVLSQMKTTEFKESYRKRVKVERVISTLVRYGIRQARYVGLEKTRLQLFFTAAVANIAKMFRHSADFVAPILHSSNRA